MAAALKVQRARQAAEQFAAAAEGVGGVAWKDLDVLRGYDGYWERFDTWFTALSATTYALLIVASLAPVVARLLMLSTASRSTVDAVDAALRLAPFVAMIAAWLFLAASHPRRR